MQFVRIYYGPCDSFYTVSHKPQKLRGLRDHLQTLGFRVDLIPVDYVNYCVLEMCGHEVFRCNIKNLAINTHFERDPVCRRAINAVVESSEKFLRARSHRWFWALIEDQIFRRSEFAPKDHWPFGLDDNLNVTKQLFK
ncbi:unnamed protein product [Pieris macdunnoughi]|uniref:Uncharacterized protein n=1 Tax=Pieris macdunnoughi TaxID=345717 RepID=A0A821LSX4_9NEOP|nr:unnamed protein product [Pieris macdunnoughi]